MQKHCKIAIAGAGVTGLSLSHALRHHDITLFDPCPDNASTMAGGMLAPYSEIEHLPAHLIEPALHSIDLWADIAGAEVKRNGTLVIAHKEDRYVLERFAQKLFAVHNAERTDNASIHELEPALNHNFEQGLFIKEEAHLNPAPVLQKLRAAVKNFRPETCDLYKAQKDFDFVIDCRGHAAQIDDKDLRGVKGEIAIVRNKEFALSRPVRLMHPRYPLYIVPRPDHIFMIGATIIESADTHVNLKSALELLSAAYSLHPSFGEAEILGIKAGIRPAYTDNLPRIQMEGNLMRCNGVFRHGFLLGPLIAQAATALIEQTQNPYISLFKGDTAHDAPDYESHRQRPVKAVQSAA